MSDEHSNSESTQGDRPIAKVTPSKKTYGSIAADVTVPSALAELIDNSKDSASIHDIDPVEVEIYRDAESGDLVYTDHAGGVAEGEMGVFLGLGQSKDVRAEGRNIGAFGLGAKKALNHLGNEFTIASRHIDADQGWKYHVSEEFFEEENDVWEFEMEPADLEPGQTEIRFHDLAFDWDEEKSDVKSRLERKYHRFIGEDHQTSERIIIELEGEELQPPADTEWTYSPWQGGAHPRKFTGLEFTNEEWSAPIQVEITVGLLREGDREIAGTAFYCQNRLVEEGRTREKGGFGVAGLNKFNAAQDKRLRIEIDFYTEGDADDLPWNSDKSRIARMHKALSGERGVYYWLRRMADRHKKIGRYGEAPPWIFTPYDADSPYAANKGEIEEVNIGAKQQRLEQGEVGQVRIHQKPDDDLSDAHAMQRVAEAHAALGIRSERVDWFESWMLPAYREAVFREFKSRYETDDEWLVELLDIDSLSEIVKDGKFDKEEVLAALHEVDEGPDGKSVPWDNSESLEAKINEIDEDAATDAEREKREEMTSIAPWKRYRYQYILYTTGDDLGADIDEFEVIETGTPQEPVVEEPNQTEESNTEAGTGQGQPTAETQPSTESDSEASGEFFEEPESTSDSLEVVTESLDDETSSTTTEDQGTLDATSTAATDSETTSSSSVAVSETSEDSTVSAETQEIPSESEEASAEAEDRVARQLRELRDEYDELLSDLDIDPEEDPEEWLPDLMQAAERLKRFESMLNDAPVEGDSFEDRLDGLLDKAKKYDQMMSVAGE